MEPLVTMYSTVWCGYCQRLKKQLNEYGVTYSEVDIEKHPEAVQIVEEVNEGNQTVPTLVFADGYAMTNPSLQAVLSKLDELESAK
ncbi:MAG: hypothetical protein RIS61_1074 [Actinomycetota bacterium]|jgi:mycoredoxin